MRRKEEQFKQFVNFLVADERMCIPSAALKAGFAKSTAKSKAYQWLTPGTKEFKPELYEYYNQQIENRKKVLIRKSEEVVEALWRIVDADITDYLVEKEIEVVESYSASGTPVIKKEIILEIKPLTNIDGRVVKEIKSNKKEVSIKLFDKISALINLGKHYGLLTSGGSTDSLSIEIKDYRGSIGQ